MKITKLWEGLKQIANGDYVLEGDLISEEIIEIDLDDRLVVRGSVVSKKGIAIRYGIKAGEGIEAGCGIKAGEGIEAGYGIKAGWGIEAGYGIKAGWGIEAGWGITAGEGIKAKTFICSEKRIFAGICVYHTNENCEKEIRCAELRKGEICFGDLVIQK